MEIVLNTWRQRNVKKATRLDSTVITQPDMSIPLDELVRRSVQGMPVNQLEPIYISSAYKSLINFENLDKIGKIEKAKEFLRQSENDVDALDKEITKRRKEQEKQVNDHTDGNKAL